MARCREEAEGKPRESVGLCNVKTMDRYFQIFISKSNWTMFDSVQLPDHSYETEKVDAGRLRTTVKYYYK
jgi:hypothetical protein